MIDIALIRADGGTQARVGLSKETVSEYRDAYLAGAEFPAVKLFFDGTDLWLADGFHRYFGAKAAGRTSIYEDITPGSRRDAVLYSLKANAKHGLKRTNADKRKSVEMMLADAEWAVWSDRKIAEACCVSDKTVAAVRSTIFGNSEDVPAVRTVERNGKTYRQDTSKIGKLTAAPALTSALSATPTAALGTPVDNAAFRRLFTLPPIRQSAATELMVPETPPQTVVTGDNEVDAVLWLQALVETGSQSLIDKALEAAKRVRTPVKELGNRYAAHIMRNGGHTMQAVFATISFGELEGRARRAIAKAACRHEALSRFGTMEALFSDTLAEAACRAALDGMTRVGAMLELDGSQTAERFTARAELAPATLADCLHEQAYWRDLYRLRHAVGDIGDADPAGQAHDDYCFAALARIPPRTAAEALAALDYLEAAGRMDSRETPAILRNLIRGPRE